VGVVHCAPAVEFGWHRLVFVVHCAPAVEFDWLLDFTSSLECFDYGVAPLRKLHPRVLSVKDRLRVPVADTDFLVQSGSATS
jgi:hypothetical protein